LGNVRELENVIQRAMVLKVNDTIGVRELSIGDFDEITMVNNNVKEEKINGLDNILRGQEYEIILQALQNNKGQRDATAKELGVSTRTLRYKLSQMKELGIQIPNSGKE
jgi:two-component system response regulator FlrC